jgi:hypothetical protein
VFFPSQDIIRYYSDQRKDVYVDFELSVSPASHVTRVSFRTPKFYILSQHTDVIGPNNSLRILTPCNRYGSEDSSVQRLFDRPTLELRRSPTNQNQHILEKGQKVASKVRKKQTKL